MRAGEDRAMVLAFDGSTAMQRRSFFAAAAGVLGLATSASAQEAPRQKVVYHLDDLDKVNEALANLRNHVAGVGGPGKADLRIVINGAALRAFKKADAEARMSSNFDMLTKATVGFEACANTMRGLEITLADLLPGFVSAEKGGVVRIAELQMQGFAYIKP
jgi:uncharacterized protein